ncbi:MAG: L,D-transpeptidase family protein [Zoogloeaceae bacterium]|jgi:murein L,D-transpeptidase YafK|nr:L,D-transpeptidase family protein [Zoogloeaceae bacterium]
MYKRLARIVLAGILLTALGRAAGTEPASDFLAQQLRYERVRVAYKSKNAALEKTLRQAGLETHDLNLLILAYKAEGVLELYVKSSAASRYQKLRDYTICRVPGKLGPKRQSGDEQVPEGFYHIDRFNPQSNFLLSLGINYPNAADRIKSKGRNPGGDIFIHGNCVSIGCLPMTDDKIREIYLYAVHARNSGQRRIPVYIFPFRMTEANMQKYAAQNAANPALLRFWKTLQTGYARFAQDAQALPVQVDEQGEYTCCGGKK